ncbi:DUF4476 domain-containing protein [Rufibacter sp. LB8]|uniref:DUF4476 domain-containing protein n=1 Tax=Rufibacter sp. LB8 TaxID=2777781 RepID=UPI00178C1846|nr:DUF4476 domain-containing protein [Rufibacter sp. LB8]
MTRFYFSVFFLFLFTSLAQAQAPREAAILVESQRGERFYVVLGGKVINTVASNRVAVADLPAGNYWLDLKVVRRGRPLNIRAQVFLKAGFEAIYVLEPARRAGFVLRKVEEIPLQPQAPLPNPDAPNNAECRGAMDERQIERTLRFMKEEGFDDRRLEIAKGELKLAGSLYTDDLLLLMQAINFEDRRVALAKFAYAYICDLREFPRVIDAVDLPSSKHQLQDFIYKR